MKTLEEIKEKLKDRNIKEVSRRTGIGYNNLYGLSTGAKKNPTYKVLVKLSDYLEAN